MILDTILQKIQEQIATLPKVNHVDENWGQLDMMPKPPVKFPCVLIDINEADFSDLKFPEQEGTFKIFIHVADLKLSNGSYRSTAAQKGKSWQIYNLLEDVHKKLQGFRPEGGDLLTGKMNRKEIRSFQNSEGLQEKVIEYELSVVGI